MQTSAAASDLQKVFSEEMLSTLFPADRANAFFEALLGDAQEGAYDIQLRFNGLGQDALEFELVLSARPGKCLACHLTWGLPKVFARHPVIDVEGLVEKIGAALDGAGRVDGWTLGKTHQVTRNVHTIPLTVKLRRR